MKYLLAVMALPLTACPTMLMAQDAEPAATAVDETDEQSEEIFVTAQRRESRLLDVPFTVTALSAEKLTEAGVNNSREIGLVTPGLRMDALGNSIQPAIRGITTTLSGGNELNVAIYLDGVVQTTAASMIFELPDVRQIEVLKGPQGTLFGRNATGGAILIHTIAPDLQDEDGKITLSYSSFDTVRAFGYASVPLVEDKVALSVAAHSEYMAKGYVRNVVPGQKEYGGKIAAQLLRAKLRFVPWDGADFTLSGTYNKRDDHVISRNSNWRGNNARALSGLYTGPLGDEPYEISTNIDPRSLSRQWIGSLRGTIEAGPGAITTTTGYVDSTVRVRSDTDLTPDAGGDLLSAFNIKTFMQEVLYTTERLGPVQAVVGANYFTNDSFTFIDLTAGNIPHAFIDAGNIKAKAAAVFGEADLRVSDRLTFVAGLRYSWERKTTGKRISGPLIIGPLPEFAPPKTWTSLDPRFSVIFQLAENTNVYATYSQGFKSGEFNLSGGTQKTPVEPERVTAYEVGLKSQVGPLYFDVAGFHYDYQDLQVLGFETINGAVFGRLTNAASAKIWGAEANANLRVTDAFRLSIGGTYLDAEYESFPSASFTTPRSELPGNLCSPLVNASTTQAICVVNGDVTGRRMIRAPKWSGNVTATFEQETSAGKFNASATLFATTKVFQDVSNRIFQPSYALLNASVAWSPLNSGLTARLWAKNITDKPVLQSLVNTTAYDNVTYAPPRTMGVDLSFEF